MAKVYPRIKIENARILFRNFEGREDRYNKLGDRNFCVLLDEVQAKELAENYGLNVKFLKSREEGDPEEAYLKIAVSYKIRPPKLVMLTTRLNPEAEDGIEIVRTDFEENNCQVFDWVDIEKVDLIFTASPWEVNGKSGIKAYAHSVWVTIVEDELDRKYADVKYAEEDE
jgi:hypothetical protein